MTSPSWCRDIDWGTAPQWATAVIALVALAFTVRGIAVATGQYKLSVKSAREAQARLVYAVVGSTSTYTAGSGPSDETVTTFEFNTMYSADDGTPLAGHHSRFVLMGRQQQLRAHRERPG